MAPDAVIEVVSRRARDGGETASKNPNDYAAVGVRYYWLVDPKLRALEILRAGADRRYVRALGAARPAGAIPGCEGLTLDLDALWAEIDDLERVRRRAELSRPRSRGSARGSRARCRWCRPRRRACRGGSA